jgi:exodeoxyribonuclease-3
MKKIISYNVNGIRAAIKKGFLDWLGNCDPDIVCIQETKAHKDQVNTAGLEDLGYHHYWHSAEKKGYSGVALFSKDKPDHVEYGCPINNGDSEGRVLRADFGDVSVISVYVPSGSSGEERQTFKMEWLTAFETYISQLRTHRPNLIISGDYNICHKPIDIHDPIRNVTSSGFLPEERAWMDHFMETGMIDSFRQFNSMPNQYSWWTYRRNARERNLGWRLDYHLATLALKDKMKRGLILSDVVHSDHCPVYLEVDF